MANNRNTAGYHATEYTQLDVSFDSIEFTTLVGAMSITESGGEASSRDVIPMSGGIGAHPTRPKVPQVQIETFAIPQMDFHAKMRAAKDNGTLIHCRWSTAQADLLGEVAGREAAISSTGNVTLTDTTTSSITSFSSEEYGPGMAIVIDGTSHIIDSVDEHGAALVKPAPNADVAADTYRLVVPAVRRGPFSCYVLDYDQLQLATEDEMKMTITLKPRAQLPATTILPVT